MAISAGPDPQGRLQARRHRQDARMVRQSHRRNAEAAAQAIRPAGATRRAIHGYDPRRGPARQARATVLPSATPTRRKYWNQCQHGSWFFLSWHRGYLLYFERICLAAIVELGGPTRLGAALLELQRRRQCSNVKLHPARLPRHDGRRPDQSTLRARAATAAPRAMTELDPLRDQHRMPQAHPVRRLPDRRQPGLRRHPRPASTIRGGPARSSGPRTTTSTAPSAG